MYTLVKTHKLPPDTDYSSVNLEDLKVRPIVSCCGSPTEKLAWLVTDIISPLLREVPSHMYNIYSHLDILSRLPESELKGLQFFTADVSALYTNLNINECIETVIEFAEEHWSKLSTYSMTLSEIRDIFTVVLTNSFFTFNGRLYKQLLGLFMGCRPSPPVAIIRMWKFERNSIYLDTYYISNPVRFMYKRYVDDAGSLAKSKEDALDMLQRIAQQDPDNRISWEIEFPSSPAEFVPFLSTEIRIDAEGKVHHRFYRKTQNKGITLHQKSHHPDSVKEECKKNFYRNATNASSGPQELSHSVKIIDDLMGKNGHQPLGQSASNRRRRTRRRQNSSDSVPLTLPFISGAVCNKIRNYIKSNKLPIRVIFTPGKKLQDIFCRSRPLDKKTCDLGNSNNCEICPKLTGTTCSTKGAVYLVTCELCGKRYCGETERSLHARLMEHRQAARNPRSNPENSLGQHYASQHRNQTPELAYRLLDIQSRTVRRKVVEAMYIMRESPELNDRSELSYLYKYLVNM
jgi:hypothetical protein